jgi:probable HAF family extracellular repeat protein
MAGAGSSLRAYPLMPRINRRRMPGCFPQFSGKRRKVCKEFTPDCLYPLDTLLFLLNLPRLPSLLRLSVHYRLSLLIGLAIAHLSPAASPYIITDLCPPGSTQSRPFAINSAGTVTGRANDTRFVYQNGTFTNIPCLPLGINEAGTIVGNELFTDDGNNNLQAVSFSGGVVTRLISFAQATLSSAAAINASGQIVGTAVFQGSSLTRPFLYQNGTLTDFIPSATYANPVDINDHGQIVGSFTASPGEQRAFLFDNGNFHVLGRLPHYVRGSEADAINARGEITGACYGTGDNARAFIYQKGKMVQIDPPKNSREHSTYGTDINDLGQVVGRYRNRNPIGAFLYENGRTIDLQDLIPASSRWIIEEGIAINNNGLIIGTGVNPAGENHAFLLTPRPVVTIRGPKRIITTRSSITLRGTATGNPDHIQASTGHKRHNGVRPAIGTNPWRATFTLHKGNNYLNIRAGIPQGSSATATVLVIRR